MMGYFFGLSPCYGCKVPFTYNVDRVPSLIVNGVREPICADCVTRANELRKKNGHPLIVPLPGAYEPEDEGNW
jgi:hypothetical protein